MKIGLIANESKDIGLAVARRLSDAIRARGGRVILASGANALEGTYEADLNALEGAYEADVNASENANAPTGAKASENANAPIGANASLDAGAFAGCDVLICVGGDGTIIKAAREAQCGGTPMLGVNLGALGYLTEVETSQIDAMLDRVFSRDYHVEERMMLTVERAPGGVRAEETAINELAIGRGSEPHVIRLKVYINDTFLDVYPGDGLLISTPTGSTAYSLSAGGPVIDPELNLISIVPVCPHVIFSRPVLVAPDKTITIVPVATGAGGAFRASVSIDGYRGPDLLDGEAIKVRKSGHMAKMLRFDADNFYVVLKNKLFETSGKFGPEGPHRGKPNNG
ncbi:MAG: NAD(+)/NADH kinase [Oscillospiraceae bacterium]|nr:NAD(+)/NADH kinase [Oscillospiraceae bacterium]